MTAWRNGRPLPEGWAMDDAGRPVTKARKAAGYRRLMPLGSSRTMGSHKGYGLATMVEILSSLLPGHRFSEKPGKSSGSVGHFFLALDPGRFRAKEEFEADLDLMLDSLRTGKRMNPEQPILVAGDPEYAAQEERAVSGIPVSRSIVEDIRLICEDSGAQFILDRK
jgi:LDH2 family malate/lactate/ureidoglycolate dehydrogenase